MAAPAEGLPGISHWVRQPIYSRHARLRVFSLCWRGHKLDYEGWGYCPGSVKGGLYLWVGPLGGVCTLACVPYMRLGTQGLEQDLCVIHHR